MYCSRAGIPAVRSVRVFAVYVSALGDAAAKFACLLAGRAVGGERDKRLQTSRRGTEKGKREENGGMGEMGEGRLAVVVLSFPRVFRFVFVEKPHGFLGLLH